MASSLQHLFKISKTPTESIVQSSGKGQDVSTAAPTLNPINYHSMFAGAKENQNLANGKGIKPQLIDVVNGFEWTHTPAHGRTEVPYIRMSEYEVEFSAILTSIRYMLTLGAGAVNQGLEFTRIAAALRGAKSAAEKAVDNASPAAGAWLKSAQAKFSKITGVAGKLAFVDAPEGAGLPDYLKPYYGLYGTQATGFEYAFPYFEQVWKEVTPLWQEYKGGGSFGASFVNDLFTAEGFGKEIVEMAKYFPGVKGTYIERPYEFQYGSNLPEWTFTFTLLNTNDWRDVIKNWQLCYLLSYQNLPNKTSKVLLDPPVIYEVEVPGIFYSPFAYIKRLSIQNKGALRLAKIDILQDNDSLDKITLPKSKSSEIGTRQDWLDSKNGSEAWKTFPDDGRIQDVMGFDAPPGAGTADTKTATIDSLVPDAYQIQITVQSLIPESKNLLFHSILGPIARNTGVYNVALNNPDEMLNVRGGAAGGSKTAAGRDRLTPGASPNASKIDSTTIDYENNREYNEPGYVDGVKQ